MRERPAPKRELKKSKKLEEAVTRRQMISAIYVNAKGEGDEGGQSPRNRGRTTGQPKEQQRSATKMKSSGKKKRKPPEDPEKIRVQNGSAR